MATPRKLSKKRKKELKRRKKNALRHKILKGQATPKQLAQNV